MKRFKSTDFLSAFKEVDLQEGDTLLIHNSLLKFGIPTDIALGSLSELIYKSLQEIIGSAGTIAVPTFNFDFCKGVPFDRQNSPSKGMGVFSEYIRTLPGSLRSKHPMQSIAVTGHLAEAAVEADTKSSFSPDGAFDVLLQNDAKILILGAHFNSVSLIHWVEEMQEVPYRYWKTFSAEYIDEGSMSHKEYQMFVRSLDLNPKLWLNPIEDELKKRKVLKEVRVGGGLIKCFSAKDFIQISKEWLKINPFYLVSNHDRYLQK